MFSSAELIEALRRRTRRSLRPLPPPGEFPPGWRDWFAAVSARPGRVGGVPPDAIVALLAAREPAPAPGVVEALGRWRAFAALWRQDWPPASRDERWTRVAAMSGSLLLHLLFAIALVWLMLFRPPFLARGEDAAREGEEQVLQVEYIGEGTPREASGGGEPAGPEAPASSAAPAATTAPAVPAVPVSPPPPPPDRTPDVVAAAPEAPRAVPVPDVVLAVPDIAPLAPPAPQVLQVTEVEVPDSRHVVPPPPEFAVRVPDAAAPEVPVQQRDVTLDQATTVVAPSLRAPVSTQPVAPAPAAARVDAVEREVELVEAPRVTLRAPAATPTAPRETRVDAPAPRPRDVPMPAAPAPATPVAGRDAGRADAGDAGGNGRAASSGATRDGGRPSASGGTQGMTATSGAGTQAGQPPGAAPSRQVADDWGDSTRNVPGRQAGTSGGSGLFDGDGRPRLADGGRVGGGLPPGVVTEDFAAIDRHGTWLKRPPYDYEPTAFDRFWMPSESLLEEWVRKSITEVRIPIPGTTKSLRCVTVLLAVGGACDILDPNLQEQPAGARPPPDVPFKPELVEDQGSLGRPPGS